MSPQESEKIASAYDRERKKLLGYIRRKVPVSMEPEDILQDVFYQLTVGFRDLDKIRNLTAWIYRVTDNRITDHFRRKRTVSLSTVPSAGRDEDEPLSLEEILPSLIWNTIVETLDELPQEQSYAFTANEFDDMSFKEMSEKTGVPVNTLISRKRYAVLALRENLAELYKLLKNQ
jgi:RNA polymerase sigma factor (sigma-70 family)